MKSLILQATSRLLMPLLLLFSIYLLIIGHNQPGGGFVGGLIAASAFVLHIIAFDLEAGRKALRVDPLFLIAVGLLVSALSGVLGMFAGKPFLTSYWWEIALTKKFTFWLGTPLFFDLGVFLVVCGVTLLIIFSLAED